MRMKSYARSAAKTRGYTAIEVLMALTIFAVGAAGIISMQRASIQGNVDARRLDVANGIAREWIERIRRDATLWTTATNLNQTKILNAYANSAAFVLPLPPGNYCPTSPTGSNNNADGLCPAFDIFGRDLSVSDATYAAYCANIRLDTVALDPNNNPDLMRAEVRVYWPRQLNAAPPTGFCTPSAMAAANGPDAANATDIYHFVYASTLVRRNPAP